MPVDPTRRNTPANTITGENLAGSTRVQESSRYCCRRAGFGASSKNRHQSWICQISLTPSVAFRLKFLADFKDFAKCEGTTNKIENHLYSWRFGRQRGAREAEACAETSGLSSKRTRSNEIMCWNSPFRQTRPAQDCNHNSIVDSFTLNAKNLCSVTKLFGKLWHDLKVTSDKRTHAANCSS